MTLSEIYVELNNGNFDVVTEQVKILNKLYREGNPLITDKEYDTLISTIKSVDPENEIFISGVIESVDEVNPERKEKLKYPMFSLDKETVLDEIKKWLINKGLPLTTDLVITAKYDGISILKNEYTGDAWSRGDGVYGETMHEHYKKLNDQGLKQNKFTIGEMIIPKQVFASNTFYRDNGEPFKNARNMIAGLKNSDTISEDLKYAKHIRYGFADDNFEQNKSEQLLAISTFFNYVPFEIRKANELNIEELNKLFTEWGKEYDIDGLVLDINDKDIRRKLGRERNNNPAYARAFKNPDWAEKAKTTILKIEWNISKQGYLKPVAILSPIDLEGVTVSRVTLNNAKFVKDNNLGVGSEVVITRSGGVIPKLIGVIKATGFAIPILKNYNIFWNDNEVELCVNNTDEQQIKKIISFFQILNTENVSEGVIKQLYEAGFKSVRAILDLTKSDFEKINRFGKRKAEIVYNSIKKATTDVSLSKLMHASNLFVGLGSKKLELLVHFKEKPLFEDIVKIEGFSDISAKAYLDNYDNFYEFIKDLPVTIGEEKVKTTVGNDLSGMVFVFTGIRMKNEEEILISRGATIGSSVSKNTTHLICKDPNSGSSKLLKAKDLGIKIMSVDELLSFLK